MLCKILFPPFLKHDIDKISQCMYVTNQLSKPSRPGLENINISLSLTHSLSLYLSLSLSLSHARRKTRTHSICDNIY